MALDPTAFDFSSFYTGADVPADPNPSEELYKSLAAASTAPTASTGATAPAPAPAPAPSAPAPAPAAPAPTGSTATQAGNPSSTTQAPAADANLLSRLAPFGITDLAQLKTKTDVELRGLAQDVVMREERDRTLGRSFFRNPDGSWDFTRGPDGRPTGLDATGRPIGTSPAAPADPPGAASTGAQTIVPQGTPASALNRTGSPSPAPGSRPTSPIKTGAAPVTKATPPKITVPNPTPAPRPTSTTSTSTSRPPSLSRPV